MGATTWQSEGGPVETEGDAFGDEAVERNCRLRPLPFTKHARKRGARRNIAPDAVEYVVAHGRKIQRTGVTFFFLGRRDIPPDDRRASWASRLEGTIVLLTSDDDVITVYRNRRGLRAIQRKMKYRIATLGCQQEVTGAAQLSMTELATA
jgi:hypothetical protein